MSYRLDAIDRRILYRLAEDARNTSAPEIAREMDVSAGTIRNRIQKMEGHGILKGYHAAVDYERVEGRLTNLYTAHAPAGERKALVHEVLQVPGVVHVREVMTGRANVHVKAVGTDTKDLARISRTLSDLGLQIEDEHLIQQEYAAAYQPFGPNDQADPRVAPEFLRLFGGAEVANVTVRTEAPIVGQTLAEARASGLLSEELLVIAIEREDEFLTPRGDTEIRSGDVVTVLSRTAVLADMLQVFAGDGAARPRE